MLTPFLGHSFLKNLFLDPESGAINYLDMANSGSINCLDMANTGPISCQNAQQILCEEISRNIKEIPRNTNGRNI